MSAEGISQAVYDLFSCSGLHDIDFVKPTVVISNYYIVNVRILLYVRMVVVP